MIYSRNKGRFTFIIFIFIYFLSLNNLAFGNDPNSNNLNSAQTELGELQKNFNGRLGIYAIDTNSQQTFAWNADKNFPIQSTMKLISVANLLANSSKNTGLLNEKIYYTKNDLVFWHPITGKFLSTGMSLRNLAKAAMIYSDNPAANLITERLGGTTALNVFAKSIGNESFNILHDDGDLNSDPSSKEDSSTPKDMAISLQKILLSELLPVTTRQELISWMMDSTTGYNRIRAGVPIGWTVAEKTGSGDTYGIANDIGITWSPYCKPIILAIYSVQNQKLAKANENVVASAAKIVMNKFSKQDKCFDEMYK